MRPNGLKTKIFLDSGFPEETREIIEQMGFLDGQTTNPTLITKHPSFVACQTRGQKCTESDAWRYYREIVTEISPLIPNGSVSIEVYADQATPADIMVSKGRELARWIPNAHIKLPITTTGLAAARTLVDEGIRVNMTLCFSQKQAAAVYAATGGAQRGRVFVSPFVGRLDDQGVDGMSLIHNVLTMFTDSDHHVEVLAASIRHLDHFLGVLATGTDIITAPAKVLEAWGQQGAPLPQASTSSSHQPSHQKSLKPIPYQTLDLTRKWQTFDIRHELTDRGLATFANDWNVLVARGGDFEPTK